MDRFVVISGCSGGGKSALLAELGRRGHAVIEEPGRRIVREELSTGGSALPWVDEAAFARRAIAMALADRASAAALNGWVFFDRGLLDAAAGLEHLTGERVLATLGQAHRYHRQVFLTPPWPEIYVTDQERRHDFNTALAEYSRVPLRSAPAFRARRRSRALQYGRRLNPTAARPRGSTGTPHARRSVAREGTARRARDPPVDFGDDPLRQRHRKSR